MREQRGTTPSGEPRILGMVSKDFPAGNLPSSVRDIDLRHESGLFHMPPLVPLGSVGTVFSRSFRRSPTGRRHCHSFRAPPRLPSPRQPVSPRVQVEVPFDLNNFAGDFAAAPLFSAVELLGISSDIIELNHVRISQKLEALVGSLSPTRPKIANLFVRPA